MEAASSFSWNITLDIDLKSIMALVGAPADATGEENRIICILFLSRGQISKWKTELSILRLLNNLREILPG